MCFNYLKNLGAEYTKYSEKYCVQGGNKEIFMQMIEEGKTFDYMINAALDYRHYEIAKYLESNFKQTFDSIAESMYFGNYEVASYLLSNGGKINNTYNLFLFIFINVLVYSFSFDIYHYFLIYTISIFLNALSALQSKLIQ